MKQAIEDFKHYLAVEKDASAYTIDSYCRDLIQFTAFLSEVGMEDFRRVDVNSVKGFLGHLHKRKLKRSSIARKLSSIRAFFDYLLRK